MYNKCLGLKIQFSGALVHVNYLLVVTPLVCGGTWKLLNDKLVGCQANFVQQLAKGFEKCVPHQHSATSALCCTNVLLHQRSTTSPFRYISLLLYKYSTSAFDCSTFDSFHLNNTAIQSQHFQTADVFQSADQRHQYSWQPDHWLHGSQWPKKQSR